MIGGDKVVIEKKNFRCLVLTMRHKSDKYICVIIRFLISLTIMCKFDSDQNRNIYILCIEISSKNGKLI